MQMLRILLISLLTGAGVTVLVWLSMEFTQTAFVWLAERKERKAAEAAAKSKVEEPAEKPAK
jgi:hypothetical protein